MTRYNHYTMLLLLLALLTAPRAAQAAESFDNCAGTIASLPAVISTPGTWCLNQNLSTSITSGNAIAITTNDVTLNCNDFAISGLNAGAGTIAYGVAATNRLNVTVQHCTIRGFYFGVSLSGGSGHTVEDNRFDGNTYVGMRVDGIRSAVQRNLVIDTGSSTVVANAFGISTNGSVDIVDNSVSGVIARAGGGGYVYGIITATNTSGSIRGNRVRELLKDGSGVVYGIWNNTSGRIILRNNDLLANGAAGTTGIRCANSTGSASDNMINGFVSGMPGCSNDGGNVISP